MALALLATAACGPTQFSDKAALTIMGAPPAPPPPPPEPEPAKPMRVEMRDNSIVINEKIQFAYNDSTILDVSFSLLDEIASVMKSAPHVKLIEIGGHASTEGSDSHNKRLSDARAKSVMKYLVEKGGVKKDLLAAKGYGEDKPLVSPEETESDREKNRRVEFLILEQDVTKKKVEVDPNTGKEKIVATSVETKKKKSEQTAAADEEAAPAEENK
jgi:OOP family OmpA-OmpF porin